MKRFLLFSYSRYYPDGGWHDFAGSYDTLAGAIAAVTAEKGLDLSEWHVVDCLTWTVVAGEDGNGGTITPNT